MTLFTSRLVFNNDKRWERQKFPTEIQMMKKIFLGQNKFKPPRKLSRKKYNVLCHTSCAVGI